jgi:hypothetical protein
VKRGADVARDGNRLSGEGCCGTGCCDPIGWPRGSYIEAMSAVKPLSICACAGGYLRVLGCRVPGAGPYLRRLWLTSSHDTDIHSVLGPVIRAHYLNLRPSDRCSAQVLPSHNTSSIHSAVMGGIPPLKVSYSPPFAAQACFQW